MSYNPIRYPEGTPEAARAIERAKEKRCVRGWKREWQRDKVWCRKLFERAWEYEMINRLSRGTADDTKRSGLASLLP